MPTLSFDGSVYYSSEVDRRELVRLAPSYDVDVLMQRARSTILALDVHEINFTDLPNNKATNILLSVAEGDVDVAITDNDSAVATYNLTPSGMIILMNTLVTDLTITANVDSVYDLIAAGKA